MTRSSARVAGVGVIAAFVVAVGLLLALRNGTILISQRGALGGVEVKAEFTNAAPLVAGQTVRVSGAIAGTVQDIDLTDHGTVMVTMRLLHDIEPPRADATASIRQLDLLGDSYLSLSPGRAKSALHGPIPTSRTIAMPRLDELLSTFRKPVRDGMQALLVQLGMQMDGRGDDLNDAILHLRPGLKAVDQLLGELDSQRASLRAVLADTQHVTGQLAAHGSDLDRSITALDSALFEARRHDPALDQTLARLPRTLTATSGVLTHLRTASATARPLAVDLAAAAPRLQRLADGLGGFSDDAIAAVRRLRPTLGRIEKVLDAAAPGLKKLSNSDPLKLLLPATDLLKALSPVFAEGADAFFGADTYGAHPEGESGLGAVAVERGDQPLAPGTDPARTWARTAVVISCEMWGAPIKPGCLTKALGALEAAVPEPASSQSAVRSSQGQGPGPLLDYLLGP